MAWLPPNRQSSTHHFRYRLLWRDFLDRQNKMSLEHSLRCRPCARLQNKTLPRETLFSSFLQVLMPKVYADEGRKVRMDDKMAPIISKVHISDEEIESVLDKETGRDRLKMMYTMREKDLGPELDLIVDVTKVCGLFSFVVFSFFGGVQSREDFITNNQHTKFPTKYKAMRSYHDAIFLGAMKYGAKWAVSSAFFGAFYLGTAFSISVYRNKSTPMEFITAGVLTGGLMKMNLGLRGFVAGGIIGGVFGTIAGTLIYGVMRLTNDTQEERHYWEIYHKIRLEKEAAILGGKNPTFTEPITLKQ